MADANSSPQKLRTEEKKEEVQTMMHTPFPKSIFLYKKYSRLLETVKASDTLASLINADPDSMASAMALKRIFW